MDVAGAMTDDRPPTIYKERNGTAMIGNSMVSDFSDYIAERTKDFSEREGVFKTIDGSLADRKRPQFFTLTGEPGIGKTAIAARLTQIRDLAAAHYCIARQAIARHLLKNLSNAKREAVLRFCAQEELFAPPLLDQDTLAASAAHIVEGCQEWRWM
jgi:ABC-type glutathione transport system ATPase component